MSDGRWTDPAQRAGRSLAARLRRRPPRDGTEETLDLTGATDDPRAAIARAAGRRPIIDVPVARLRPYSLSLAASDAVRNAFTRSVQEFLDLGVDAYPGSALQRLHARWVPPDLGAVYGVPGPLTGRLARGPAIQGCHPWLHDLSAASVDAVRLAHEATLASMLGPGGPHGYPAFGPVSPEAGAYYLGRYLSLATAIREAGHDDRADPPSMTVLSDGEEWAGWLVDGNHRVAIDSALGHESIRVAVTRRVVRRDDAASWPGVTSGLYSTAQAVTVFDRFLTGTPPDGYPDLDP